MKDSWYIYVYNNEEMEGGQFGGRMRGEVGGAGGQGDHCDSPGRWEAQGTSGMHKTSQGGPK
jgi:hypothetical protein